MQKRKLKKISFIFASAALATMFAVPVAAAEDTAGQVESSGVYVFKDAKKDGTVTFIKKWKDNKDNNERDVPDIEISTEKPEGMIVKYKVTFHGNGLTFADGTSDNEMVYTSNGQIVDGQYKVPVGTNVCWYADTSYKTRVTVLNDGSLNTEITRDIELYAKEATFVLKSGDDINELIPDEASAVYFTNEVMPDNATAIDVDDDGDCGVTAWMDGSVMKISTQINDVKAIVNVNSRNMFNKKTNLTEIYFDNIDTSMTTNMQSMFLGCSSLQKLDLSAFNTSKVTYMNSMFSGCGNITQINLESFDTHFQCAQYEQYVLWVQQH